MPRMRIRPAITGAMAEVDQAAGSVDNAARWATAIMERVWKHGVEVELKIPESVRQKLQGIWQIGPILLKLLDAIDDVELEVRLGEPESPKPVETKP